MKKKWFVHFGSLCRKKKDGSISFRLLPSAEAVTGGPFGSSSLSFSWLFWKLAFTAFE